MSPLKPKDAKRIRSEAKEYADAYKATVQTEVAVQALTDEMYKARAARAQADHRLEEASRGLDSALAEMPREDARRTEDHRQSDVWSLPDTPPRRGREGCLGHPNKHARFLTGRLCTE